MSNLNKRGKFKSPFKADEEESQQHFASSVGIKRGGQYQKATLQMDFRQNEKKQKISHNIKPNQHLSKFEAMFDRQDDDPNLPYQSRQICRPYQKQDEPVQREVDEYPQLDEVPAPLTLQRIAFRPSVLKPKVQEPVQEGQYLYDKILSGMVSSRVDDNGDVVPSQQQDEEAGIYDGEDQWQPYNVFAEQEGRKNEWKENKFDWDEMVVDINRKVFGNEIFFENQKEIINAALSERDVMALIPTGGGKSLTFQVPALVNKGYTFVIMPLISLIEDQIAQLKMRKVKCFYFSKSIQKEKQKRFFSDLLAGRDENMRLIYLTPEKLVQSHSFTSLLDKLYAEDRINRFVIDEVHCLSHWGQDFRKDYRELSILRVRYPKVPIIALTATATVPVKYDIVQILKLRNVVYFQSSFNRPNLYYEIRDKQKVKKMSENIYMLIKEKFMFQSGIIYCLSRKECEELTRDLCEMDLKCDYYHAKMTDDSRKEVQLRWMRNEIHIIIATIAFGMGINKMDVRFVIHTTIPKSLENYAQECGRAGRDGKPASCILYYSYQDRKRLEYFIITNADNTLGRKNENLHALYKILEFCEEPYHCRRKIQLNYLGEDFRSKKCKAMCDNCRKGLRVADIDFTDQARLIVHMVEVAQRRKMDLTVIQICNFLRGKKQGIANPSKNVKMDDIKYQFYGKLRDYSEEILKRIVMRLLIFKVLKEKFNSFKVEQTILVYLIPGRKLENFKNGDVRVALTDCLEKDCEKEYLRQKIREDKELMRKHVEGEKEDAKKAKKAKKRKLPKKKRTQLEDILLECDPLDQRLTQLDSMQIQSILPDHQKDELFQRLLLVRNKVLEGLSGKTYYLFNQIFNNDFLTVICYILPKNEDDFFENELIILSQEHRFFIQKFFAPFLNEVTHFIDVHQISEQVRIRECTYTIQKHGVALSSFSKQSPFSNFKQGQKFEEERRAKKKVNHVNAEEGLDLFQKKLAEMAKVSDLEVNEVEQQNKSLAPIRKGRGGGVQRRRDFKAERKAEERETKEVKMQMEREAKGDFGISDEGEKQPKFQFKGGNRKKK